MLSDLSSLFDVVGQYSIALTPHLLSPLAGADAIPRELNILQSGTFNGGVIAVADTPVSAPVSDMVGRTPRDRLPARDCRWSALRAAVARPGACVLRRRPHPS